MIKLAQMGKELKIKVINEIGVLADISKIVTDRGINIVGAAGYAVEKEAHIMLVTEDNLRAKDALIKNGYKNTVENPVIIIELENKTGSLKNVTAKLASEGIDIEYIYGSACAGTCPARIFLSTSNDEKAIVAFNK